MVDAVAREVVEKEEDMMSFGTHFCCTTETAIEETGAGNLAGGERESVVGPLSEETSFLGLVVAYFPVDLPACIVLS